MIEKWRLTISQNKKYEFTGSDYTESIVMTHNQSTKLLDVVNYINDTFPEKFKFELESIEEDEDNVDE